MNIYHVSIVVHEADEGHMDWIVRAHNKDEALAALQCDAFYLSTERTARERGWAPSVVLALMRGQRHVRIE